MIPCKRLAWDVQDGGKSSSRCLHYRQPGIFRSWRMSSLLLSTILLLERKSEGKRRDLVAHMVETPYSSNFVTYPGLLVHISLRWSQVLPLPE